MENARLASERLPLKEDGFLSPRCATVARYQEHSSENPLFAAFVGSGVGVSVWLQQADGFEGLCTVGRKNRLAADSCSARGETCPAGYQKTDRTRGYRCAMTTIITKNGTGIPQRVGPDLETRLERALKQIRDLERELNEVLNRLSALEGRGQSSQGSLS